MKWLDQSPTRLDAILIALVVWAGLLAFPTSLVSADLDPSWQAVLSFFFRKKAQIGVDYFFTYGPLGAFLTNVFDSAQFFPRYAWEIVTKLIFAVVFCRVATGQTRVRAWTLTLFALFFFPWSPDAQWFLFSWWAIALVIRDEVPHGEFFLGAALALFALVKFTLLITSVLGMMILLLARGFRPGALAAVGGFLLGFLVLWVFCGQDLGHLPGYFRASWEISSGHVESMVLGGNPLELKLAVVLALLFAVAPFLRGQPWDRAGAGLALWAVGGFYIEWKHGFVRHDAHSVTFFVFCFFLAFFFADRRIAPRAHVALVLVAALSLFGIKLSLPETFRRAAEAVPARFAKNLGILVAPQRTADLLSAREFQRASERGLLAIRYRVGGGTVDLFSVSQGMIFLSGLGQNYTPRPAFQSYFAYTPFLLRANEAFYRSEKAPDQVIFHLEPIDNRFPLLEDGPAVLQVLAGYQPTLMERDYLLLERKRPPRSAEVPVVSSGKTGFAQEWPLTGKLYQRLAIDLRYSWLGILRKFWFRPPIVYLDTWDYTGLKKRFVISAGLARPGFLVNPFVENNRELADVARGVGKRIARIAVVVAEENRKFFRPEIGLELVSADNLATLAAAE